MDTISFDPRLVWPWQGVQDDDPWSLFGRLRDWMMLKAWLMQDNNRSYRDFGVGAVALVYDSYTETAGVILGTNYKEHPKQLKLCAEMGILLHMRSSGEHVERWGFIPQKKFDVVVALVISGPLQPDAVSGLVTPTLHPCAECRDMFEQEPEFRDDTLVVTTRTEANVFRGSFEVTVEEHTVAELLTRHRHEPSPQPFSATLTLLPRK
jgi:cytidine deaminase